MLYSNPETLHMQVLYTLPTAGGSPDDALVSEVGSMNVMFLFDKVGYLSWCLTLETLRLISVSGAQGFKEGRCYLPD